MICPRIALQLPGQGSQFVGMGKDLAEAHPDVRELYQEADALLSAPLSRLSWEGPEDELTRTENAQPAILLHSYAVWTLFPEQIRSASVVAAGHSLGEFTAYLLAGSLELGDALRLVRRRGELMARAGRERPGEMAAIIGLEPEIVREICAEVEEGVVVPANFNAPGQIVVSGDAAGVAGALSRAMQAGARRAMPLKVSGAFHSPLMETAHSGLATALESVRLGNPCFPVVANASAAPVRESAVARALLIRQLTSPVRWIECVGAMREIGVDCWLEVGPGKVLSGLLRRIDRSQTVQAAGDVAGIESFLEGLEDA